MIKKLRRKFILLSMLSVFVILAVTIGAINISNYAVVESEASTVLREVVRQGTNEPMNGGPGGEGRKENVELRQEHYFVVSFDDDGTIHRTNNAHMFYIVCRSLEERTRLINHLKEHGILAVFHYLSLHKSDYYTAHYNDVPDLPLCDLYADRLVRLPLYYDLTPEQVDGIVAQINTFFSAR